MNMTHPDILEAERNGLPEDEPEMIECSCGLKIDKEMARTCHNCGHILCSKCWVWSSELLEVWCKGGDCQSDDLIKGMVEETYKRISIQNQLRDDNNLLELAKGQEISSELHGRIMAYFNIWKKE